MPFTPFATATAAAVTILSPSGDTTGTIDSATVTNAIAAAAAVATPGNVRTVQLGAGTWNFGANQIPIVGPVRLVGSGAALVNGGSLLPGTVVNCSNGTGVFTFPFQGYLWGGLEVEAIAFNYSGAGNLFHNMNLADSRFRDLAISLTNAAGRAFFTTGNVSVLDCEWERVYITTTSGTRSNEMIHLSSTASGSISNNTFWKCRFQNAGSDNTQYMIYIDCAGGAAAYHYMETFRDCWFGRPFGGAIKSLSGMALVIDGCTTWDIFSGQGFTVGNSTYYIGAFPATGPGSQQTRINGCSRNRNGPDGAATWDIFCESTTCGTIIEGFTVKPDTASTTTNFFINLNAHPDVQLIGNLSPQGSTVNGNSNTIVTNPSMSTSILGAIGSSGTALDIGAAAAWQPGDSGVIAWNFDPGLLVPSTAGNALTNNTIFVIRVNLRRPASVTNVLVFLGTAGTGLTAGQNFAGLYNSAGTLIGTSADQSANWAGAAGLKTIPLTGGPFVLQAGFYWVALLTNQAAGTNPAFGRAQNTTGVLSNIGVTAATARWATNTTGTTLPGSITPASNTLANGFISYWAGVS